MAYGAVAKNNEESPFMNTIRAPSWTRDEYARLGHVIADTQHLITFEKLNLPPKNKKIDNVIHDPEEVEI